MPTLRRSLSKFVRTPELEARAKRVGLTKGSAKDQLKRLIRVSRAIRVMSRRH